MIVTQMILIALLMTTPPQPNCQQPSADNNDFQVCEDDEPPQIHSAYHYLMNDKLHGAHIIIEEEVDVPEVRSFYDWLQMAGVPEMWWAEFAEVAACESSYNPMAEGDGGVAKGLFQIHWNTTWANWANSNWFLWKDYGIEHGIISIQDFNDRYDPFTNKFYYFGPNEWGDPVKNIQLAWIINVFYDQRRYGFFWNQWPGHPHINACESMRDYYDSSGHVLRYVSSDS